MAVKMHKLEQRSHFERLEANFRASLVKAAGWLAEGRGSPQSIHQRLCQDSMTLGCIVLILGGDEAEARAHFLASADYALKWLRAPGSVGGPRVFDVTVKVSETDVRTAVRGIPPSRQPRKLSVIGYTEILFTTVAFGDRAGMLDVAALPEEDYQNPDVVAGPEVFMHLRAWKAWLRGDEGQARKEALAFLKTAREAAGRAGMSAFLAMTARDAKNFHKHLEERLEGYRRQYQKEPNVPYGFVCMDGLALCRVAAERGIVVEDSPYLPVRLLPVLSSSALVH